MAACAMAQDSLPKPSVPVTIESTQKGTSQERQLSSIEQQRQSASRQMQTIRQHYPSTFAATGSIVPAPPSGDCPSVTPNQVKPIIDGAAARHNLDARLIEAVVETESAYSPCAVSRVGAMGLMQLMPATAETLHVTDAFDPLQNISAGTQYLKQMLERYGGDVGKALAAYNAGPGRVDAAGGIPPIAETQEYVRKIMGKLALVPRLPIE